MSYRILRITTFYPEYLNQFYSQERNLFSLSYEEHFRRLMDDGFAWGDALSRNLRKMGVEAFDIVANATPLQKTWAKEHNFVGTEKDLLIEQIRTVRPDVLYFITYPFSKPFLLEIKEKCPFLRKMMGWCCAPFTKTDVEKFKVYDFMVSGVSSFLPLLGSYGIKVFILPHGFDETILSKISSPTPETQKTDLIFSGSFYGGSSYHEERLEFIFHLLKKGNRIDIRSASSQDSLLRSLAKKMVFKMVQPFVHPELPPPSSAGRFLRFARSHYIRSQIGGLQKPPLFGLSMLQALAQSKICFNIHIGIAGSFAGNLRLFEATGAGTCLLTDWKENLSQFFEPDLEVVSYRSLEECIEKIHWLLSHESERKKIALAGQKRCLSHHNLQIRAMELDQMIRKEM